MVDMKINLAGLELNSPIIAAAGTSGYIAELADVLDPSKLGAIVTKSITAQPRDGHPPWRIIEVPRGMLNAIGLANVGLDVFINEKLPAAAKINTTIIGSIAGSSIDDYVKVATAFDEAEYLPAVELNVSCPNTGDGRQFGEHPDGLRKLLMEVRPVLGKTRMIVKLSPNVNDIVRMAEVAIDEKADALTLINTVAAMAIDVESCKPRLSNGAGGLSGPAIHPIAVRMVSEVYRSVAKDAQVPIIGLGGVMNWEDAAEFILAGASAVGMGTAMFVDPKSPIKVLKGLTDWVKRQGCSSITELVGQVKFE